MSRRVHIINRCDGCGVEELLSDASEDELDVDFEALGTQGNYNSIGRHIAVIPLVDDGWAEIDGRDLCPNCQEHYYYSTPDYGPDTLEEAEL